MTLTTSATTAAALALVALAACAPTPDSATVASSGASSGTGDYLAAHNAVRARHCAPPLTRSAALEAEAGAHAQRLIASGSLQHSASANGENLYSRAGSGSAVAAAGSAFSAAVESWRAEASNYDFATGQSRGGEIGHFTQLVWKGSTQLGCAAASGDVSGMTRTVVVCQYAPAGNRMGAYAENVAPAEC